MKSRLFLNRLRAVLLRKRYSVPLALLGFILVFHCAVPVARFQDPYSLVLLDRNPLEDIRNTRSIRGVSVGGRWLNRGQLDDLLEDVADHYRASKPRPPPALPARARWPASPPAPPRPARQPVLSSRYARDASQSLSKDRSRGSAPPWSG